ncbi:MAG: hypothetical protein LBE91_07465 [Tannerella sp.]|jgi:hypothetical protein|nr:hypothetical protein [Tannerella sp.]
MSYIFRLHTEGNNALTDWGNSSKYGTNVIEQIQDPNGESAKREITSIPSPFARIDLVKTAFGKVAAMGIDGKTIHHKMVSDAFDVGQIFFEYDKFADQLEIIVWDKENDMNELLESPYREHELLGKTYDIFLKQDGRKYNFARMDRMYLLNYKNGIGITNIIGATSPATLFFSSANDFSEAGETIRFGNDRPFDDEYMPLYRRDLEYQKFWYLLRIVNREFPRLFPEVNKYLDENFEKLTQQTQQIIRNLQASAMDNYAEVAVNGEAGNLVYVINGMPVRQKVQDAQAIECSGFLLARSDYRIDGKKPLVLPVDTYTKQTLYTMEAWDRNIKIPYYDPAPQSERTLPGDGSKYPYFTIGDFLTDTVIRMPYGINSANFFDGNFDRADGNSYLLPLKSLFFECFTVEQLTGTLSNGKKMFELQNRPDGIKAVLRIPVKDDVIEYSRIYFEGGTDPDKTKETNDGALLEKKFGLGIMPLVKFPDDVEKYYRIALFDKGELDVKLTCYRGNSPIKEEAHIVREAKNIDLNECSKEAYVITDNFDRINVSVSDIQGVIIPKFKITNGNRIFTFAIDFGTTNTHIEYGFVTNEGQLPSNSNSFDILSGEEQMLRLHTQYSDRDINGAFVHNFIPNTIGDKNKDDFSFPMRTVFSEWNRNNRSDNMYALANGNIPFLYEREMFPDAYNEARTELKWRGEEEDCLVKLYLENIFLLLRNKVILNGGNLKATKIIWFYPASMDTGKFDNFNGYWMEFYKKYFGGDAEKNLITISESAAPHRYYKRKKGASTEVVTIDVGGGTTDVYIVEDDKPQMLLSFLFASNAIFGDGGIGNEARWDSDSNGFIQRYYNEFIETLSACGLDDLTATIQQITRYQNSSDIIAFLFSLLGNKKVKGNESLNFLAKLSNNKKFKYVFILFYGAIIYFIAKSMRTKGLKRPLTLAFSGNGSKTLRVLSSNNNTIGEFAQLIFDGVYGTKGSRLDIIFEDEPKKATSKGGILNSIPQTPADIKKIKFTLIGDNMNCMASKEVKFEDITESVQKQIVNSVIEFVDFLFELHEKNDEFLTASLGADDSIINKVKEICKDRIELSQSLKSALSHKRENKKVEETLFFYPLIGVLHELASKINKM